MSLGGSSGIPARRTQSSCPGIYGIQGCCEEVVRLNRVAGWDGLSSVESGNGMTSGRLSLSF